jgi:AcrR family transcriptional regulator
MHLSGNGVTHQHRDRRVARTRNAIVEAYNHLFQHRRPHSITVADIVEQANVGRSTFYEHYGGADAVFLEAVSRPLALLADAVAGRQSADSLAPLLRHFWDNRQRARELLYGRAGERVARLLGDLVEARLPEAPPLLIPRRLAAMQLAEGALAPIRGWLTAEAPCAPDALAHAICAAAQATLAALRVEG